MFRSLLLFEKAIATGTMRAQSFHLYCIEVKLDESNLFPFPEKGEVRHAIYDFIMLVLQHF